MPNTNSSISAPKDKIHCKPTQVKGKKLTQFQGATDYYSSPYLLVFVALVFLEHLIRCDCRAKILAVC